MDLLDVESGECRRMELFCWIEVRMDPTESHEQDLPQCLRLSLSWRLQAVTGTPWTLPKELWTRFLLSCLLRS
jgi:hypothetical protein